MSIPARPDTPTPIGSDTERALSGLFLESPIPMALVDVRSRRITRANAALERLLGHGAGNLEGQRLREIDAGPPDEVEEHLLLALACRDDRPRKRRWSTAHGTSVPVEILAARLHGDHGTLLALYVRDTRRDDEAGEADSQAPRVGAAREHEVELPPRTVDLNQVLEEAEATLREGLSQDIGLLVRPSPEPALVSADLGRLREVVIRLVERAHQAMPDGGYVVVSTEAVELDGDFVEEHPSVRPGHHVMLSVTDTGMGMDEAARSRLATVYGIVEQSGGAIGVTSRPEIGTTFRIYLPRVEA